MSAQTPVASATTNPRDDDEPRPSGARLVNGVGQEGRATDTPVNAAPPALENPNAGDVPLVDSRGNVQGQGSEGESDRSSRLQAEVQKQLEEYKAKQQLEVDRLQREIQQLRAEREQARGVIGQHQGPATVPQSRVVPEGNLGQHQGPTTVPQSRVVPEGNLGQHQGPASVPQGQSVPGGNLGQHQGPASVPQGQSVPGGNLGQHQGPASVPQGQSVPGGNLGQHQGPASVPEGNRSQHTESFQNMSSAQQWLGPQGTNGTIAMIADGMAQLQAAMIKQLDKGAEGDRSPEQVKPGTTALPLLKEVAAETACVDVMDWLEMIDGPMSDLSDSSAGWWRAVMSEANRAYGIWTQAAPLDKLSIAPDPTNLENGKFSRLNSRAAAMIIASLHDSVKQEVVARRLTGSTVRLIFRILTLYQPGGEDEKYKILQNLQSPTPETEPGRAVTALRAWSRWLKRCTELHVQAPDPSLLARGLTQLVKAVIEKSSDASFRTSLIKSILQIDTNPSYDKVDSYYKHLMAECEALALTTPTTSYPMTTVVKPEAKLKPVKPEGRPTSGTHCSSAPPGRATTSTSTSSSTVPEATQHTGPKSEVPCRYFGRTAKGCSRASKCPFMHSWEGLDKKDRCLNCGGKGHAAKDCSAKRTPPASTSTTPKSGDERPPSTSTSTTTTRTVRIDERPEVLTAPSRPTEGAPTPNDLKDVLADVGKVLKATQATSLKRAKVQELQADEFADNGFKEAMARMRKFVDEKVVFEDDGKEEFTRDLGNTEFLAPPDGLLDSGASHAMRAATNKAYQSGHPVSVTLAGEDVKVLRQNKQGTILVESEQGPVQAIVPLGAIIQDLGYTLSWGPKHLKLSHPEKGPIKVKINNNCPEVTACDALALIRDLELTKVATLNAHVNTLKARLEVLKLEEKRDWPELMKEYMKDGRRGTLLKALLKCPFTKGLPSDVHSMLLEDFNLDDGMKYLKDLPIARRTRKSLMNSRSWVVSLYGGDSASVDPFKLVPAAGKTLLEIDIKNSRMWDVHRGRGVYRLLLWAAATGRVSDVIASQPDKSWTTSLEPTRTPWRSDEEPFGKAILKPLQRQRALQDTAKVAQQMLIWMLATLKGRGNVGFLLELPSGSLENYYEEQLGATLWGSEMWRAFKSTSGMTRASFDMGGFGHRCSRPTTVGTNYPILAQMDGMHEVAEGCLPSSLVTGAERRSWSQQFKHLVLEGVSDFHSGTWVEEEELVNVGAKLSKLTKEQRELWKKHLLNDHQPYRADCSVCINAQASGYQHRRRRHHHLYTVALDVAGPFKTKGRDMEFDDYKYILVASYRCPKDYMAAKAIPDLDAELYVPDTDEDEQPDDEVLQSEDELLQPDQEESGIEEELEIHGPPTVDEVVEELQEPIETKTIYLARPMRRRTTSATLLAAKEMMVQLRQNGLYVNAIHTDRAREFGSRAFKAWIGECGVRHTKTARGDPAGNSTAELGVKWLKSRVRALLRSSGAGATEWPMAVNHAVMGLWSKAFPSSLWTSPPAAPFGSEVWFRAKAYKGTKEKAKDPTDVRWKRGFYRGPATDVSRGHLLMREDGGLVIAKGVKFNVLDPASELRDLLPPMTAEGLEADECEVEHASRKQLVAEVEFISKCLLSEENFDLKETLKLYNKLEELGDVDFRVGKKTAATSWYTGAYVHGGCAGLRRNLQSFPNTSKYLVSLGKKYAKGEGFSAVALARNATLGMHRDSHNYKHSKNIVVPISRFEGGALWAEDPDVEEKDNVPKQTPSGQEVRGRLHPMRQGEPVMFSPRRWHEVQQWEGDRVMLMLYTPRATKLAEKDAATLEEFGFPLDRKALDRDPEELDEGETEKSLQEEPKLFSVQLQDKLEPIVFIEVEDEDLLDGEEIGSKAKSLKRIVKKEAQQAAKAINKKAELQYTNNIEEIIKLHEEKGTPLDVTHAVSLQEVKKNLPAWRSSALKEYHNLKDNKRAFEVRKKHELPPGCRIVPCNGVYTVKPDKDGLYRRKTRFVACGNHVPEGQEGMELFAAGLDATTLRTMLAYTIDQPWAYGTTDIRQAFVLAPWLGQAVALQPPAIAYELGLAEPGDYWFVLMSIYGLRESPALWSKFRDEQLEGARWTAVIDGKEERLRLRQMVTDDQVWKIEREQGDQQPLGYIMVYVDDILINSLPEAMRSFYEWLASRWECDNLDVLGENHPIRFLGMEVHLVDSGIELAQEGFIRELLRSHGHDGSRAKAQGPKDTMVLTLEEEEAMITAQPSDLSGREDEVKMAQRRVGELLWLSGRTRPDVQYVTALLSSRITRCPEIVNQVGIRMLSYLNETLHYRIRFSQPEVPMDHIKVFTDSSFAPSSGRSHGSAGVFVNNNPVSWRSSRQQLVTLSTAESELLEAVEGVVLANATATLVSELRGCRLPVHLHIDNQSALMLLNGSTGSWRTRHQRLRANYVRERLQLGEIHLQYEPGATQRADLGTKPFTKERLSQLIKLWNIIDRRSTEATVRAASATSSPTWLSKLLMFCQLCGVTAQKEQIQAEVPWDLYLVVLVLAIAVIGIWEGGKHCCRGKEIRLQALRSRASYGKLTRIELKELQRLLALEPGDLTDQQGERLLYLKDLFEQSMPSNTSPVPTVPLDTPHRMQEASSSTTPSKPTTRDVGTQKDYVPAFERAGHQPPVRVETVTYSGPFHHVPGRDVIHLQADCWGLRHAGRTNVLNLCRCCLNGGRSLYDRG